MNPLDIISAFTQNLSHIVKISKPTTNKGNQSFNAIFDLPEGFKNMAIELQNMKKRNYHLMLKIIY